MTDFDGAPLRGQLSPDQRTLLETIHSPFRQYRVWPVWQYVDLTMDARNLDASEVLASLPSVQGGSNMPGSGYGLVWYMNPSYSPQPDQQVALTVAGLWHLEDGAPLLGALLRVLKYLVAEQQKVIPSPTEVVEATIESDAIREHLARERLDPDFVDGATDAVRQLLEHEPRLLVGVHRPSRESPAWTMRLPAALRELRGTETIEEYVDQVVRWTAAPSMQMVKPPLGPVDIPYSLGYLDAVWKSKTGSYLFSRLDPTSVARLTQPCTSEADFNSLVSALADALSQVRPPDASSVPHRDALERFRDYLCPRLETGASERVEDAIATLIGIRHLRVSTQHGDARHRAVDAFRTLGLDFPPTGWAHAWSQIAVLAMGSLEAVREEVQVGDVTPGSQVLPAPLT